MNSLRILGTGHYAPAFTIDNEYFTSFVDTSDEWISTRTGMKTRHCSLDEPTWMLGLNAARNAMNAARLAPDDIDMVVASTCTPDFATPSTASIIQRELGITGAFSFDVNIACTGLAFVIDLARRYLATGVKKILIVCAESLTQYADYTDRSMCILFGDGAGALIVEAAEGIYGTYQSCDISATHHVYCKRERQPTPFNQNPDQILNDPFPIEVQRFMKMNGREVYKLATKAMPEAINKACESAGITVSELDFIIPHQANLRIIETAAKNMGIPLERMSVNVHEYGNTSSASIAICLDGLILDQKIKRGDKICLVGFGAGFSYGATVFEY